MTWLPYWPVLVCLVIVGASSGALGCFAVLRRQSLLGDTVAHAALPGVCLAYLFTNIKDPFVLLCGAMVTGVLGTLLVLGILNTSRLKQDSALGIVLSLFFGVGIVLLSHIQNRKGTEPSGLEAFIYGQAALLTRDHIPTVLGFGLVVFALLALLYKEFKLLSFDPEYASTLGFRRRWLEVALAMLIVIGVMIGLRAVGVVLTVALLIAPAAAARQWTERLGTMIALAMAFAIVSAIGGAVWSQNISYTPAGPAIVLVATGLLVISMTLAPSRGWLWNWTHVRAYREAVRRENLLSDFYRLGEARRDWEASRGLAELARVRGQPPGPLVRVLDDLQARGYIEQTDGHWRLTPRGLDEATRLVRNHRLWELYLARRLDLAADHVHRDAEAMEHVLAPEIVRELQATLENPERDPHGNVIPRVASGA